MLLVGEGAVGLGVVILVETGGVDGLLMDDDITSEDGCDVVTGPWGDDVPAAVFVVIADELGVAAWLAVDPVADGCGVVGAEVVWLVVLTAGEEVVADVVGAAVVGVVGTSGI